LNPVDKEVPGYYELIKYPMGKFFFLIEFCFLNYGQLFNYISDTINYKNNCIIKVHFKMYNNLFLLYNCMGE